MFQYQIVLIGTDSSDWDFENFTISVWFNRTIDPPVRQRLISHQDGDEQWALYTDGGDTIEFGSSQDGLGDNVCYVDVDLNDGQWHNIIVIRNMGTNIKMYIDGVENDTCAVGEAAYNIAETLEIGRYISGGEYWNGTMDEIGIWNRTLSSSEVSELYNSGNGLPYLLSAPEIKVTLTSPSDNFISSDIGINFTANYSITSLYNLTNATYYIWDETGIFNNSVVVEITGRENSTTEYIDSFTLGDYEWNVYACYENDTFSNCTFADSNYSFFIGASIINNSYNNITYETSSETFSTIINLISGTTIYDAQLYYNETLYEGTFTDLGNGSYNLSSTFDIPLVSSSPEKREWYWKLIYKKNDETFVYQNLTSNYQNVSEINLFTSGCSEGINSTLNFSAYDEENSSIISNFVFTGSFEYWLGSGTKRKNISISNLNVANEMMLCIYPNNLTYHSDAIIQYEKSNYIKRNYYLVNSSLTNTTNHIGLYLLNSSMSTSFIINVIDNVQFPITGAYVYIQRYYPGTGLTHTVEMSKTDDSGNAIGHFEAETEDYKIIVLKDGVILYESKVQKVVCGSTPCTLNFQIEAAAPIEWKNFGDLPNIIWTLDYNESTKLWTYIYVDTSGTTKYGRLLVYTEDGNNKIIICNKTDTSSAATLTCNVTDYDGTIYAEVYISRSPETFLWLDSIVEKLSKAIFGMEGLFWATIILLVIGLVGIWNSAVGIVMMIAGVITINILQLAALGTTTIMGIVFIGIILLWELKS